MIRSPSRWASARQIRDGDTGVTLAELLVAMGLLSVISAVVFSTFLQGVDATRSADARTSDGAQARLALFDASKLLRAAVDPDGKHDLVAIETAKANDLVFYTAIRTKGATVTLDRYPMQVRIWLDTSTRTLMEQRIEPAVIEVGGVQTPSWNMPGTKRVIARFVTLPQPGPIFTYLAGNNLTVGADGRAVSSLAHEGANGISDVDERKKIRGIEIWLSLNSAPDQRSDGTTAVSRVTLLNKA